MKQKGKTDPFLAAVCEAVHLRRGQLGISQEELAQRAGLHRTYISDIERGARNPTLKTLSRLAVALEISASKLLRMAEASSPELSLADTGNGAPASASLS
ncbi:MAG: helix-turn-helix transcriptional regulator [Candidatus Obscuribacterales bacterium]|nr:helix-turn-helix transcriptional regulator [Candidatus Obscuribacterales bacterium]